MFNEDLIKRYKDYLDMHSDDKTKLSVFTIIASSVLTTLNVEFKECNAHNFAIGEVVVKFTTPKYNNNIALDDNGTSIKILNLTNPFGREYTTDSLDKFVITLAKDLTYVTISLNADDIDPAEVEEYTNTMGLLKFLRKVTDVELTQEMFDEACTKEIERINQIALKAREEQSYQEV